MDIIECKNITKRVTDKKNRVLSILDDVSFGIREGEIFTIIGPSGSGKTSLLRLLNRLDEPTSGEVFFKGKPVCEYSPHLLRRFIAIAFQHPKLFGPKILDDLMYPFIIDPKPPGNDEIRSRGVDLLARVGLHTDFIDRDVDRLSGGETMRVAMARALMRRPEVLLLDEPTAGLDPEAAQALLDTVLALNRDSGLTIVVVTHRFAYAKRIGQRTMLLECGKVVEIGDTTEFFKNPKTESAMIFLKTEGMGTT